MLTAHDPNDFAHGMGLVVNNTLRELSFIRDVQVTLGLLLADDRRHRIDPPPELRVQLDNAVIACSRKFHPRRERFRCLLNGAPPPEGEKFLLAVERESARVDAVVWFGYFWDSVSAWLPRFCSAPITFHVNDSLSLAELSHHAHHGIMREARMRWARWQERRIVTSGYSTIVYCSRADAAEAQSLVGYVNTPAIVGLENGVDTARFKPGPSRVERHEDRPVCLFVGRLDYPPNIAAVRAIVNLILPKVPPNVDFWIAGANPGQEIRQMFQEQPNQLRLFPDVPDMVELYRAADVFLAPMTGKAGIKNKILEAAACGLPIVTTSDGASGLGKTLQGITVCSTMAEMAGSVLELLARAPSSRHAESLALRDCVSRYFSWKTRTTKLLSLLADAPAGQER